MSVLRDKRVMPIVIFARFRSVRLTILGVHQIPSKAYSEDSKPPSNSETFAIMRDAISEDYIRNYVRTFKGSPFARCTEVVFAASESIVPQPDEGSYAPAATPTMAP
jgi:hypothetical protein